MKNPELKDIKAAYEVADENGKKMLRALYHDVFTTEACDNRSVTERIKTFEDACNALGGGHSFVKSLNGYVNHIQEEDANDSDVVAFLKLRIVAAALNEGWAPDWGNKDQDKWYPWFYILTEQECNDLEEDEKCRVVGRAYYHAYAYGGLVYAHAVYVSSNSYTGFGSRLAFKSSELAEYCAKQFGELWATFLIA